MLDKGYFIQVRLMTLDLHMIAGQREEAI